MIVTVSDDLRVRGDPRQWVIDRKSTGAKGGKPVWGAESYHPSLPVALRHARDVLLREVPGQVDLGELVPVVARVGDELAAMMLAWDEEQRVYLAALEPVDKPVGNLCASGG